MINLIDKEVDGNQRKYGVSHFDVSDFDEIHRSVYNKYKAVLIILMLIKLGLLLLLKILQIRIPTNFLTYPKEILPITMI